MSFLKSIFSSKNKSANEMKFPPMSEEMLAGIVGVFSCPNECQDRGFILWMRSDPPVCDKCGALLNIILSTEDLMKLSENKK